MAELSRKGIYIITLGGLKFQAGRPERQDAPRYSPETPQPLPAGIIEATRACMRTRVRAHTHTHTHTHMKGENPATCLQQ